MSTTTLIVQQGQLANGRIVTREAAPLAPGQVRLRVDSFALTANNITYAAFGESMHYWQFFPSGEPGWGIVPVWGFATVLQSLQPGVAVGERLYGYWPMSNEAILQPVDIGEKGFVDGSAHRSSLPAVYNRYLRCNRDPFAAGASESMQALMRPLFSTSWLIDDFLADNDFFGARVVMLSSASSKTAYGTALMFAQRADVEVIGFTSERNRAFCEALGCYSRVLGYEALESLPADTACVYVDFAGNADFRRRVHTHFSNLRYSCSVGGTHVEELGGARGLPGPRAMLFFAPAQAQKRQADWGGPALHQKLVDAWRTFSAKVSGSDPPWLEVRRHRGAAEVLAAYAQVYAGSGDPRLGHILSLA